MGAWGEKPFENDHSLDWVDSLKSNKMLIEEINKALTKKGKNEDEVRAASQLIIDAHKARLIHEIDLPNLISAAIESLEELLENDSWIKTWSYQDKIRKSIATQMRQLRALQSKVGERNVNTA